MLHLDQNQLVGVGTMAPDKQASVDIKEIGCATGGTVDKTPTRNQEQ